MTRWVWMESGPVRFSPLRTKARPRFSQHCRFTSSPVFSNCFSLLFFFFFYSEKREKERERAYYKAVALSTGIPNMYEKRLRIYIQKGRRSLPRRLSESHRLIFMFSFYFIFLNFLDHLSLLMHFTK